MTVGMKIACTMKIVMPGCGSLDDGKIRQLHDDAEYSGGNVMSRAFAAESGEGSIIVKVSDRVAFMGRFTKTVSFIPSSFALPETKHSDIGLTERVSRIENALAYLHSVHHCAEDDDDGERCTSCTMADILEGKEIY